MYARLIPFMLLVTCTPPFMFSESYIRPVFCLCTIIRVLHLFAKINYSLLSVFDVIIKSFVDKTVRYLLNVNLFYLFSDFNVLLVRGSHAHA